MIVRFATFNIRYSRTFDGLRSWPFRRKRTAATIDALDVDVLGLQEVLEPQRRYLARKTPGLRWFGDGREGGRLGEQCCIAVSAAHLTVLEHRTRWFGPHPSTPGSRMPHASLPRIATSIRCRDERSDTEFNVVNTHLDHRIEANRTASVRQLVNWLDLTVPTVVLGDFNATPESTPVFGPLIEAGFTRAAVTGGTYNDFTARAAGPQIDHVFVSAHWTIEDAAVIREHPGRKPPSDHWPVRVTARV